MRLKTLAVIFLTVSITAGGYIVAVGFCDIFRDTWLGSFCPDEPAGGGGSGAEYYPQ